MTHPAVPISLEALSKPRPGYKVVRPSFPPGGGISTAVTTTGLYPTIGQGVPSAYHPPSGPHQGYPAAGIPVSVQVIQCTPHHT